ncbi:MAG: UDP-N-acetylmuramoyl-L-alanyl-D-glutamate--2,6-diaminopimelate ligase [Eubacterium sp.]|nr:UDP-N-acetylmuramoyl-L-alanyl-D-glutamate--2,6-diaminopimelate ligase [Eubacterium sp.]
MKLSYLLEKLEYETVKGTTDTEITDLVYDSRKVTKGSVFVCIKGAASDGHKYANDAASKGAFALITEDDVEVDDSFDITIIKTKDTRKALAVLSAAYFSHPADRLKVIGVTGTKGKTTTTYMVKSILERAGIKTGLIGTIETIIGDKHIPAVNTTPESYIVQKSFAEMEKEGIECVVMEVSSQGLMMHRVAGFEFEMGIFTNIEPDHIGPNEHASFEEYLECKAMLFKQCRYGLINLDDKHYKDIIKDATCSIKTYGFNEGASYRAENVNMFSGGGSLGVEYDITGDLDAHIVSHVPGKFSVYNTLCSAAICDHFGIDKKNIEEALLNPKVKGRIEPVKVSDDFTLMIDYAHNAMALESLLSTLKAYNPKRLVCLFGCGGNRSKLRRYEMGEVSGKLADLTVITSDNPRDEDPQDIINDIKIGMEKTDGKYIEIADRKEAIKYVIENGQPGDIIILAGKGHEDYQEIKGKKYPMDERVIIKEILEELKG